MMLTIKADHNIVVFSEPGSDAFQVCHQKDFGYSELYDPIEPTFVVRPFSDGIPAVYIKAEVLHPLKKDKIHVEFPENDLEQSIEKGHYMQMVETLKATSSQIDGKVVLSRIEPVDCERIDLLESLKALRSKFPRAFVYLLKTESYGVWMGATPEQLLMRDEEDYQTMALAGTKPGEELFTQKEFDEQLLVTKDIVSLLSDVTIEVSDLHEETYGDIRHLRTFVRWQSMKPMMEFAERLHPTPAVAGYPRNEARNAIAEVEMHNRSLYTGYLGLVQPKSRSTLFVNLRCMQLFQDRIWFYVGGGINAASDPESEWDETNQKMQTVMDAIVYE